MCAYTGGAGPQHGTRLSVRDRLGVIGASVIGHVWEHELPRGRLKKNPSLCHFRLFTLNHIEAYNAVRCVLYIMMGNKGW